MLTVVERAAGHLPESLPSWEAPCGEPLRLVVADPQVAPHHTVVCLIAVK